MAGRGQVAALGRLEGVRESTLCTLDGVVLESSSAHPELDAAAVSLQSALSAMQGSVSGYTTPVTLTAETEEGALHLTLTKKSLLVVTTGSDANIGSVRLEMRDALKAVEE